MKCSVHKIFIVETEILIQMNFRGFRQLYSPFQRILHMRYGIYGYFSICKWLCSIKIQIKVVQIEWIFFCWCVLFVALFFIYNRLAIWWEKWHHLNTKRQKTPTSKHKHAHEHIILIGIASFTGAWPFASIDKIQLNRFFLFGLKKQ